MAGLLGWIIWPTEDDSLPAAVTLKRDVQYFAPKPDFPLADEEAALAELQQ